MKRCLLVFLSILFLAPHVTLAADVNAGFVQGLWYSTDTIFNGTPTRIYVALRNNTPHDLTGTVRFNDNGTRIGSMEVSALSGRLVEAWTDWTPTAGEHALTANLSDATLHIIGGEVEHIDISHILAEDTLTIDTDTDKDTIGDAVDTDDDNDGISDTDEKNRGSDPLVANPIPLSVTEEESDSLNPVLLTDNHLTQTPTNSRPGLEQYTDGGVADSFLSSATAKVVQAKDSLDSYREKRNEQAVSANTTEDSSETDLGTYTENATITRSKIETNNSFLSSFISVVASIFTKVWTFILFLTSRALAYPALIEFIFLIVILLSIYRIARRVGRRPGY